MTLPEKSSGDGDQIAALTDALKEADKALRENITAWITVAPILEANVFDPRDDGYVWNAWTRFGERAGKRASAARRTIRRALSSTTKGKAQSGQ